MDKVDAASDGLRNAQQSSQVFALDRWCWSVEDVLRAGDLQGRLEAARQQLRVALARMKYAEDAGNEVDEDAFQGISDEYRYARELITAEETEEWLASRGLTMDDFQEYLRRAYWSKAGESEPAEPPNTQSVESDAFGNLLRTDLLLSGEFDRMAVEFSWRAAAWAFERGANSAPFPPACEAAWEERISEMEAAYLKARDAVLTPEHFAQTLQAARWPLSRLEIETIEFDSLDAAREGFLCVREDGLSVETLAHEGRYPFRRNNALAEDFPEEFQECLFSLSEGGLLEPAMDDGVYRLHRLTRKTPADAADPEVKQRVEQRILRARFMELAQRHIRWFMPCAEGQFGGG